MKAVCQVCTKPSDTSIHFEWGAPILGVEKYLTMCPECWRKVVMSQVVKVQFKKLVPNAIMPVKANADDACFDLFSVETVSVGSHTIIGTGIAVAIPPGYEMQIRSRSGLAAKASIQVLNAPGTIDAGYRGEVKVILQNHGPAYLINAGDRIAQCCVLPVTPTTFVEVDTLTETKRGEGGFGSTGK